MTEPLSSKDQNQGSDTSFKLRKADKSKLKEGDIIYFEYEHNYNSRSRAMRYKRGLFLGEKSKKAVLILQILHGGSWNGTVTVCEFDRIYVDTNPREKRFDVVGAVNHLREWKARIELEKPSKNHCFGCNKEFYLMYVHENEPDALCKGCVLVRVFGKELMEEKKNE